MDLKVLFLFLPVFGLSLVVGVSCCRNKPVFVPVSEEGYWQDLEDPSYLLGVEDHRLIVAYSGRVREVVGILGKAGTETRICYSGRETRTVLRPVGEELAFLDPFRNQNHRLRRLPGKPAFLSLASFHLPSPAPVGEEKIREVQKELWRRSQQDQTVLGRQRVPSAETFPWLQEKTRSLPDSSLEPGVEIQLADLTLKNSEYLRGLLLEVGWIDVERFGYSASNAAFLILQHSWDVPMMIAALPSLKKDVDRGLMESDTYALLYDRLQLALGLRQRYGSQIARTPQGEPFVLPVEGDPSQIDDFRRQLGLIPLADYVRVFGALEIRFSSDCQPETRKE